MAEDQSVTLAIKARDQAKETIGQTTRDIIRLREEVKQLTAAGDRSAEGNRRLGDTLANLNAVRQRQREALRQVQQSTVELNNTQKALTDTLNSSAREIANQAGVAGRLAASMGGTALAIGAVAGAATVLVGSVVAASRAIGDFQERQDILGDTLDLTQREVGALTLGAANVGRTFEAIQPALFIFTRRLGEAREGSEEALKSFRDLGIDPLKDFRTAGAILGDVGKAIDSVGDKSVRNKTLVELFGRGGSQIVPVLRQDFQELAETAERTGITLSESAQKTAREADVAWDRFGASVKGLSNTIMVALAPAGTAIANFATSVVSSLKGIEQQSAKTDLSKTVDELDRLRKMSVDTKAAVDDVAGSLTSQALQNREGGMVGGLLSSTAGLLAPQRSTSASMGLRIGGTVQQESADTRAAAEALMVDTVAKAAADRKRAEEEWKNAMTLPFAGQSSSEFFQRQRNPFRGQESLDEMSESVVNLRIAFSEQEKQTKAYKEAMADAKNIQGEVADSTVAQTRAVEQSIAAFGDLILATRQTGQSLVATAGQFAAQLLSIIGALSRNAALGPVGALVGLVTSVLPGSSRATTSSGIQSSRQLAMPQSSSQPATVHITIQGANLGSRAETRRMVNEDIIPEINRALRFGTASG